MEDNTTPPTDELVAEDALPSVREYTMAMAMRDCVRAKRLHFLLLQTAIVVLLLFFYVFLNTRIQGIVGFFVVAQIFWSLKVFSDVYEQYKSTRAQRHLALLEHATMDVQDDALIPEMTFIQMVRARMGFVWRENKTRIAIVGVLFPAGTMAMVLFYGGSVGLAVVIAVVWLLVFIVVIATMTSWEVVFPRKETRKQLDAEILLARKKMAYDDLQGALSSPNMDAQKRGALSEAEQKEGGLTPVE